ncbi:cytochrome c biogenesis protein ResB [Inhella proteolytica]|uniref:Cytochrome c biogenesis protein ResB n=1 Tax=Inhella proteolytica TaxID=2795029 RepID=A0A931NJI9_9BURK|nr:cytochrome c biogenesis protein ResB [Inhella proteolytica]MBH9578690.1 cytochrome c biogenesis protein ResB [Inhella proteolytica]
MKPGWAGRAWRALGSMRFAVALLALVATAASVGTWVEQLQVEPLYVQRFGLLQARVVKLLGLDDVFHAAWFLALLGFLALSTGLCVWRNTPKMLREFADFKTGLAFRQLSRLPGARVLELRDPGRARHVALRVLEAAGFQVRDHSADGALALTARAGHWRRIGYVATHLAVVVICVGGLLDANPLQQWQRWRGSLVPSPAHMAVAQAVDEAARDPARVASSGAFRGAVQLAPGQRTQHAAVPVAEGFVLRRLPVALALESFHIDYHPSGQPKDFISELRALEPVSGQVLARLRVGMNAPAQYGGLQIYQSGFDDAGTRLQAELLEDGGHRRVPITARVGAAQPVMVEGQPWTLEPSSFRLKNVLPETEAADADWRATFLSGPRATPVRDLGPSLTLTLRDAAGQGVTQTAYVEPLHWDGRAYAVLGIERAGADTRWLRLPLDADGRLDRYTQLLASLRQPETRAALARKLVGAQRPQATHEVVARALDRAAADFLAKGLPGLAGLADVGGGPERAALFDLLLRAGVLAVLEAEPACPPVQARQFVGDALAAYDAWLGGGRPPLLRPLQAEPVTATVLQVAQAPGAPIVYAGMGLLALGVALMVLQRERRVWIRGDGAGRVVLACTGLQGAVPGDGQWIEELLAAWAAPRMGDGNR